MNVMMLHPSMLLVSVVVLPVSLPGCPAATAQDLRTFPEYSSSAAAEPSPAPLALELDRAIRVLRRGLKENWETRDQYLTAFEKTPSTDTAGQPVRDARNYVECAIGAHLRIHQIWDEGSPLGVEIDQTIAEFTKLRNEIEQANTAKDGSSNRNVQPSRFPLSPCAVSPRRKIALSAGVAAVMLKTQIDPVYPTDVNVSGTVVLDATISTEGRVEALRVISGPAMLRQAALDAVRQWTYRPYRLNNVAVEVETTINVVFVPLH